MGGSVDDILKSVGATCTIIRTGGNVDTYLYINPKGSFEKSAPYERNAMMPTDSGVVEGDLIQYLSDYFLAVSVFQDRRVGEFFYNKVRLFRCNNTITVKAYNSTTKVFADSKTGVPCLVIDSNAYLTSDRGVVVPGFSGRDDIYYLYAQQSAGIGKNSILVDASSNHLRVADNINFYFASGLIEAPVKLEVK